MSFDVEYAAEVLPSLLSGAVVTIEATFAAMAVALVLGLLVALMRRSSVRPVRIAADGYVQVIRNTPLLIQMYVIFIVIPVIPDLFLNGVVALGLNYTAYLSETYRAGIEAVPRGQWEAASAIGLSRRQLWQLVVLPQAIRPIIPPLGNYLISMFKDTPMLFTIGVLELMGSAIRAGSSHYRYFEPLLMVGVIFLAMSLPAAYGVRRLERRLSPG